MIYGGALKPGTGNLSSLLCRPLRSPSHPTDWPVRSYRKTHFLLSPPPLHPSLFYSRSFWLLPLLHSLVIPLLHDFPPLHRFARFFSSARGIPEGISTFLTAVTAFIPSSSSPGRAYKGNPGSDNARGREREDNASVHKSVSPNNHPYWFIAADGSIDCARAIERSGALGTCVTANRGTRRPCKVTARGCALYIELRAARGKLARENGR